MACACKDLGAAGRQEIEELPLMDTPLRTLMTLEAELSEAVENEAFG